jgi:predicted metal-dependent hydrolase
MSTTPPWNATVPRTRVLDALSLLLPAGERFVMATLEEWRRQRPDEVPPALQAEIDRFIREERAHQRAHERYNAALLAAMPGAARVARRAARASDELHRLPLKMRLALCAAFELLTAVVSRELLERPFLLARPATSAPARMWRWHAQEELDHCHVALQAAACGGVGRLRRLLALAVATAYLAFDVATAATALVRCDIAAGAPAGRTMADTAALFARGLPAAARLSLGWLRCIVA